MRRQCQFYNIQVWDEAIKVFIQLGGSYIYITSIIVKRSIYLSSHKLICPSIRSEPLIQIGVNVLQCKSFISQNIQYPNWKVKISMFWWHWKKHLITFINPTFQIVCWKKSETKVLDKTVRLIQANKPESLIRKHSPKTDIFCNVFLMYEWNHELSKCCEIRCSGNIEHFLPHTWHPSR